MGVIKEILRHKPSQKFAIFSDGTDEELSAIISLPNTQRVFFGNEYNDLYAISKCKMLVGSNSTFSAWGAFLGLIPVVFRSREFGPMYEGMCDVPEIVLGDATKLPEEITSLFKS